MKASITACLLTCDEADRLPATLAALSHHVGRILVLDSGSKDGTIEIAKAAGAEVIERPWEGWVVARNYLLSQVQSPWTVMLDADEVLDEAFWRELAETGFPNVVWSSASARRETVYLGRRMHYAWQPDWKTFLFRTGKAAFLGGAVHERIEVGGDSVRLSARVAHFSYRDFDDHIQRMRRYAKLGAQDLRARGIQVRWRDLTLRPLWHVVRMLVLRRAMLDGVHGWLAAVGAGVSVWLRYAYAWAAERGYGGSE